MFSYSIYKRQLEALLSKYEEYVDNQFKMARKGSQSFESAFAMCNGYRDSLKEISNDAVFRTKLNNITYKILCYMIDADVKKEGIHNV